MGIRKSGSGWTIDDTSDDDFQDLIDWGSDEPDDEETTVVESECDIPITSTEKKLEEAEKFIDDLRGRILKKQEQWAEKESGFRDKLREQQDRISSTQSANDSLEKASVTHLDMIKDLTVDKRNLIKASRESTKAIAEVNNDIAKLISNKQSYDIKKLGNENDLKRIEKLKQEAIILNRKLAVLEVERGEYQSGLYQADQKVKEAMVIEKSAKQRESKMREDFKELGKVKISLRKKGEEFEKLKREFGLVKNSKEGHQDFKDTYLKLRKKYEDLQQAYAGNLETFMADKKEDLVEMFGKEVIQFDTAIKDWLEMLKGENKESVGFVKKFIRRFK